MSGVLDFEAFALRLSEELAAFSGHGEATVDRLGLLLVVGRPADHYPQVRRSREAFCCLVVLGAGLLGKLTDWLQPIGGRTEPFQR